MTTVPFHLSRLIIVISLVFFNFFKASLNYFGALFRIGVRI